MTARGHSRQTRTLVRARPLNRARTAAGHRGIFTWQFSQHGPRADERFRKRHRQEDRREAQKHKQAVSSSSVSRMQPGRTEELPHAVQQLHGQAVEFLGRHRLIGSLQGLARQKLAFGEDS